jgi:hypothetical protein
MNSCYVNVIGGVGNQLFQIAAGYAYAKKHGKKLIINPYNWFAGQGTNPLVYKDTIFKNFEYGNYSENVTPIQEKRFNYDEPPFIEGSVSFNGYFQSLKYFEEYKDEFISLLNLPEVDVLPKWGNNLNIAFHIRRGDYLNHATIHYVCETEYFNKLFDIFTPEIVKNTKILVFTDSPEIVLEEFKGKEFIIMKSDSDIKELAYMSKCDIVVGSNSTFSWWAALIGDKTSYFPSKWFGDGREATDIYYDKMIKCDV